MKQFTTDYIKNFQFFNKTTTMKRKDKKYQYPERVINIKDSFISCQAPEGKIQRVSYSIENVYTVENYMLGEN